MTEYEFDTVGLGNVLYRNDTGQVRVIDGGRREYEGGPAQVLWTRNALLVGREGFTKDRLDIYRKDIGAWEVWESINDITNRKLKEKIIIYELENYKMFVDAIAPQLKERITVSHFL